MKMARAGLPREFSESPGVEDRVLNKFPGNYILTVDNKETTKDKFI